MATSLKARIEPPRESDIRRFMAKTSVDDGTRCLIWTGGTMVSRGMARYGSFFQGGRVLGAHRVALSWATGIDQTHLTVDHLCRNSLCVNPDHLEWVTQRENNRRSDNASGRHARATECPSGHPYDEINTYVRPDGTGRGCKTCRRGA